MNESVETPVILFDPLKTSPKYTRAWVYRKCMLWQNQIILNMLRLRLVGNWYLVHGSCGHFPGEVQQAQGSTLGDPLPHVGHGSTPSPHMEG